MIGGAFAGTVSPVIKLMLINDACLSRRGIESSLHATFDDHGKGLGPFATSMLIVLLNGNRKDAVSNVAMSLF